jgi:diguanylate cyclase (GGDEF)-like protein/PAS domain S-box-containing protein
VAKVSKQWDADSRSVRVISWLTLSHLPAPLALAVIVLLFPAAFFAAYAVGGADKVAPDWFFLPVFLAGLRFGPRGALASGVVAMFMAGPLLPADVATHAHQATSDWVSRGIFFVLIGELVTYLIIAVRGTTTRAVQAEAQGESEQRFRALVQRATDMITVLDEQGRLSWESPAVERILGWGAGYRLGQLGGEFVHPDDQAAASGAFEAVLADPAVSQSVEMRLADSQGRWRWAESMFTNLLDEPTVRGVVINHRVVDERKVLEDELVHRAFHDSLTGLANRALLRGRVEGSIGVVGAAGRRKSVLFIDLDDFKTVNDGFGHGIGDQLLIEVSDRLRGCVGEPNLMARLGGDEFAVLVEDRSAAADGASLVARRLMEALEKPFDVAGHQLRVSASIGIAQFDERADADTVLMQADLAMYHAKASGKGQFAFFSEEMQEVVMHRLDVESWLRAALETQQISVHYQPIISMADGRVDMVEALVRWRHPTMGVLSPADFLDVAEETGLIVPLGKLVLREACRHIRRWRDQFDDKMMVSVNLSAAQLRDPGLPDEIHQAMTEAGIGPGALMVEVTEGALISDVAGTRTLLESLWSLGVTIAIDDFGTGYSSLSHLQRFPVDVIKIDKSFVDSVCVGSEESMVVRSVLAIGAEFGLQVVAEGIESEEQHVELQRLGCDYGQGYLYAIPTPAQGIDDLLSLVQAIDVIGEEKDCSAKPVHVKAGWRPAHSMRD